MRGVERGRSVERNRGGGVAVALGIILELQRMRCVIAGA
jgi:hypothetical protein